MAKNQYELNGQFDDQKGIVERLEITGANGNGVLCRKYRWIKPKVPELAGKTFEAFDDQIRNACRGPN